MPFSSGTYTGLSNSFNDAVAETVIDPLDWNALFTDIETAFSGLAAGTAGTAPATKTGDFTLGATERRVLNNKSSDCIVTLPAASSSTGREVTFANIAAHKLDSASSNVVPLGSASAGTAILTANAGRWATLVSDGTNWIIMAGVV